MLFNLIFDSIQICAYYEEEFQTLKILNFM
jgi:hypothetical protein